MIFDKLCGVVERHFKNLIYPLKHANIFQFEGIPHDVLPRIMQNRPPDYFEHLFDSFFLPYPVTAIEDKASCIILVDTEENQTGLGNTRHFIEAMLPGVDNSDYFNDSESDRQLLKNLKLGQNVPKNCVCLTYGRIRFRAANLEHLVVTGGVIAIHFADKKRIIYKNMQDKIDRNKMVEVALKNAATAIEEVLFFNQPDKFILQRKNVKAQKIAKNKIARSHQRPVYTLLHPAQIRARLGISNPSSLQRQVTPHERRRHQRYLSSAIYDRDDNGIKIEPKIIPQGPRKGQPYYKSVNIPASWIGPSEKVVGNKRYKVILDR